MDTLKEVIEFAISEEQAAQRTYARCRDLAGSKVLRTMFIDLENLEKGHEKKLKDLLVKGADISINASDAEKVTDLMVTDHMVEKKEADLDTVEEIMVFAAKAEKRAADLYTQCAALVQDEIAGALFGALAQEEQKHKLMLEKEYEDHCMPEN